MDYLSEKCKKCNENFALVLKEGNTKCEDISNNPKFNECN